MISEEFVVPKWVKMEDGANDRYTRFVVEPFERGYGTTIGNSLRRILLASLEGCAITAIKVEGVNHEFSAVPGIQEDLTDVILNLKKCKLKLEGDQDSHIYSVTYQGQGTVTAGELFKGSDLKVLDPDHYLFTSTNKSTKLEMEVKVARGRGYLTADHFELEHAPLGTVYLDANFSPVEKVNFQVEDARVGQTTDYDRLILEVWTDGGITPEKAVQEAAELLIEHVKIFVKQETADSAQSSGSGTDDPELTRMLSRPVEELEMSVRAANCLKAANISTILELVSRDEVEMLQFHNFGKKSLDEIKAILETMGLSLGMIKNPNAAPLSMAASAVALDDEDE